MCIIHILYIYTLSYKKKTPLESTGVGPTNRIQHCFHDPQRQGTTGRPSKTWRWNVTNKYYKFANNNGDEPTVMGIKLIKLLSNDINMYQWGYDPHRFGPMSVWVPMWDKSDNLSWCNAWNTLQISPVWFAVRQERQLPSQKGTAKWELTPQSSHPIAKDRLWLRMCFVISASDGWRCEILHNSEE